MLAKAGPAGARAGAPLTGLSSSAPKSATISAHQAEEAKRCAAEGVRQVQQRRFAQGIALLNRAIELRPSMASLRHDLGVALMAAGQLKEAAAAFNAALGLDPRLPSAHFHIGQILENLGQLDKAIPAFEAAVALAPDVVAAQMRLGSFYLDRRMYAKSEAAFRAAAAAGKGTVTAAIAEAGALEASGAIDNAVAAIRALVDSIPRTRSAIRFWLCTPLSPGTLRSPPGITSAPPSFYPIWPLRGPASRSTRSSPLATAR